MSKQIFKFAMGTILKMPGQNGAPGIVRSRIEHDDSPTEYFVTGLDGPRRAPALFFTEGELLEANPPEPHVIETVKKAKKRK